MKVMSRILLLLISVAGAYYFFQESDLTIEEAIRKAEEAIPFTDNDRPAESDQPAEPAGKALNSEFDNQANTLEVEGELSAFVGKNTEDLVDAFGEPVRKDPSSYGYESWIYTDESNRYLEFGILNKQVSMIYAAGENVSIAPAEIGQPYELLNEEFTFTSELSFTSGGNPYRFQLSEEDLKMRPIIQVSDDTFMQFYFDTFENKLFSVRFINKDILLSHRPYEIYYRAELPTQPALSEEEWEAIQAGMAKQVFDITNVLRHQYGVSSLKWDDKAAAVASGHSKDMYQNNYFSHYSLDGRGLKERLNEFDVRYFSAGENIAAQYTDSPAAVVGWLNSEGHRETLLNDQYTHLGVGVYHYYYTQNFLQKS